MEKSSRRSAGPGRCSIDRILLQAEAVRHKLRSPELQLEHDPQKCEAVFPRQTRSVCSEIMLKQRAKAR
jgi:hypothetical protein